jgi:hypothetical protein
MEPAVLLALRHRVPDGVLLDCLDLQHWLAPFINGPEPVRVTTKQLMTRWCCSQPAVSRRMNALRRYGLAEIRSRGGRGAWWSVRRIGLPAPIDNDKRTVMHLVTAKLERRLAYWRQREQEEILKRYRMVTSI